MATGTVQSLGFRSAMRFDLSLFSRKPKIRSEPQITQIPQTIPVEDVGVEHCKN